MDHQTLRLYRFRFSTNVDRVALALAHKGLGVESVWIDPGDRSAVVEVSGQELVPVLVDGDTVVPDSTAILEHLEALEPDRPLYPSGPAERETVRVFVEWFNRVWKAEPNLVAAALDAGRGLEDPEVAAWAATVQGRLDVFERLLTGREHLFGAFGAADCAAWPFVRYAAFRDPEDDETFHRVLEDHQRLDPDRHANVAAWIARVRERPQV